MPRYNYRCSNQHSFNVVCQPDKRQDQVCPECSQKAEQVAGSISVLKRGDGWIGKNLSIERQMETKNRALDLKMRDRRETLPTLLPNVGGEECESWVEAKHVAAKKGLDTASYDLKILETGGTK